MSIVGGMGMFSNSIFNPIIGRWIDTNALRKPQPVYPEMRWN
jgi:hypothetical protein